MSRTGSSDDGEWLHINGKYWNQIDEILVYAFIYDGVPNWSETDGVVTIYVPNEPIVETRMTEGSNIKRMCCIARISNKDNAIKLERINRYFNGQRDMDLEFGWFFNWVHGTKD